MASSFCASSPDSPAFPLILTSGALVMGMAGEPPGVQLSGVSHVVVPSSLSSRPDEHPVAHMRTPVLSLPAVIVHPLTPCDTCRTGCSAWCGTAATGAYLIRGTFEFLETINESVIDSFKHNW